MASGANADPCCRRHSADYAPFDYRLNLSEILRVIQFYNSDAVHFCADSEDGYCLGQDKNEPRMNSDGHR